VSVSKSYRDKDILELCLDIINQPTLGFQSFFVISAENKDGGNGGVHINRLDFVNFDENMYKDKSKIAEMNFYKKSTGPPPNKDIIGMRKKDSIEFHL
jgi:hypothetical protein